MFKINHNNLNIVSYKIKKITLSASTILKSKIRLFTRNKTICGIELLFFQSNIEFSTVILLKDFFTHPTLRFKDVIFSLIEKEVHLFYQPERIHEPPYFQIAETLNFETNSNFFNSIFNDVYKSDTGYYASSLLNYQANLLKDIELGNIIAQENKNVLVTYDDCYVHLNRLNDTNNSICLQILNHYNDIEYTGYLFIQDFLLNPQESLISFLEKSNNTIYGLKTDLIKHGYFYLTANEIFNEGGGKSLNELSMMEALSWDLEELQTIFDKILNDLKTIWNNEWTKKEENMSDENDGSDGTDGSGEFSGGASGSSGSDEQDKTGGSDTSPQDDEGSNPNDTKDSDDKDNNGDNTGDNDHNEAKTLTNKDDDSSGGKNDGNNNKSDDGHNGGNTDHKIDSDASYTHPTLNITKPKNTSSAYEMIYQSLIKPKPKQETKHEIKKDKMIENKQEDKDVKEIKEIKEAKEIKHASKQETLNKNKTSTDAKLPKKEQTTNFKKITNPFLSLFENITKDELNLKKMPLTSFLTATSLLLNDTLLLSNPKKDKQLKQPKNTNDLDVFDDFYYPSSFSYFLRSKLRQNKQKNPDTNPTNNLPTFFINLLKIQNNLLNQKYNKQTTNKINACLNVVSKYLATLLNNKTKITEPKLLKQWQKLSVLNFENDDYKTIINKLKSLTSQNPNENDKNNNSNTLLNDFSINDEDSADSLSQNLQKLFKLNNK